MIFQVYICIGMHMGNILAQVGKDIVERPWVAYINSLKTVSLFFLQLVIVHHCVKTIWYIHLVRVIFWHNSTKILWIDLGSP